MALNINSLKIKELPMLTDQQRDELLANRPAGTITPEHIENVINGMAFWNPHANSTLTICVLTLKNGFQVTGQSSCVNAENFDAELGKKLAYDNAVSKVWELEGYLMKESTFLNAAKSSEAPVATTDAQGPTDNSVQAGVVEPPAQAEAAPVQTQTAEQAPAQEATQPQQPGVQEAA